MSADSCCLHAEEWQVLASDLQLDAIANRLQHLERAFLFGSFEAEIGLDTPFSDRLPVAYPKFAADFIAYDMDSEQVDTATQCDPQDPLAAPMPASATTSTQALQKLRRSRCLGRATQTEDFTKADAEPPLYSRASCSTDI